jgi:hypothetical protein
LGKIVGANQQLSLVKGGAVRKPKSLAKAAAELLRGGKCRGAGYLDIFEISFHLYVYQRQEKKQF